MHLRNVMARIAFLLTTIATVWAGPIVTSDLNQGISRLTVQQKLTIMFPRTEMLKMETTKEQEEKAIETTIYNNELFTKEPEQDIAYVGGNESSTARGMPLSKGQFFSVLLDRLHAERLLIDETLLLLEELLKNETHHHLPELFSFLAHHFSFEESDNHVLKDLNGSGLPISIARKTFILSNSQLVNALQTDLVHRNTQIDDSTRYSEQDAPSRRRRETTEENKVLRRQKRFFFWPYLAFSSLYLPYIYSGLYSPYYYSPYIYYRYPYMLTYGYNGYYPYVYYMNPTVAVNPAGQPVSTPAPAAVSAGK